MRKHNFDLINKILPINCEAYLKNKGWQETGEISNIAKIFGRANDNGRFFEVLVPSKKDFLDFNNTIVNLLLTLQDFEERELDYIAQDIIQSKYDVFRIIAFKGETVSSLSFEDAATLFQNSLTMMASSAQSILSPQPYFSSRRPKQVSDFLSKLRMGHTERGSFIVTLHTPIAPSMTIPELIEEDEQFERQVTIRLCSLIYEAVNIVNEPNPETLMTSAKHGMSANFIEALAEITKICGDIGASLNMTWASIRPISQNIRNNFVVKREFTDSLYEAGRTLRYIPESNIEIAGFITTLHKETDANTGIIKVHDITESKLGLITITLALDDYNKALDAHKNGNIVIVRGDLQKKGLRSQMNIVSEFKIIADEQFYP